MYSNCRVLIVLGLVVFTTNTANALTVTTQFDDAIVHPGGQSSMTIYLNSLQWADGSPSPVAAWGVLAMNYSSLPMPSAVESIDGYDIYTNGDDVYDEGIFSGKTVSAFNTFREGIFAVFGILNGQAGNIGVNDKAITYFLSIDPNAVQGTQHSYKFNRFDASIDMGLGESTGTFSIPDIVGSSFWVAFRGDANLDGKVSLLDLNTLGKNFGQSGSSWEDADFNQDGTVSLDDLNLLGGNWGQEISFSASESSEQSVVPEPSTLLLLLIGGFGVIRSRRAT